MKKIKNDGTSDFSSEFSEGANFEEASNEEEEVHGQMFKEIYEE